MTQPERLLLAAGTTLGVVAMTVALWPALRSLGFRWHLRFDWRHETVRRLLHLAAGWRSTCREPDRLLHHHPFTGHPEAGAHYVVYSQAFIFFSLPHAIIAVSIFTALLPGMSARWTDREFGGRARAVLAWDARHA